MRELSGPDTRPDLGRRHAQFHGEHHTTQDAWSDLVGEVRGPQGGCGVLFEQPVNEHF